MADLNYKQSLDAAVKELAALLQKQEELEIELEAVKDRSWVLRNAVHSLADLCGLNAEQTYPNLFPDTMSPDVGFTDAVRGVLRDNAGFWSTPAQIRDKLQEKGFDVDKYSNPLASIHTILKRLQRNGEVTSHNTFDNRTGYTWTGKMKGKKLNTRKQE